MKNRLGVRTSVLLLVLVTIIPFLVNGYVDAEAIRERLQATAERETSSFVRGAIADQALLLESSRQILSLLVRQPDVVGGQGAPCNATVSQLRQASAAYENIGVAGLDGIIWCSAVPTMGAVQIGGQSFFQRAVSTGTFSIGDYSVATITGRPALGLGQAVPDEAGNPVAVAFASLDLAWMTVLAQSTSLPSDGALTVIDSTGTILARHPEGARYAGQRMLGNGTVVDQMLGQVRGSLTARGVDGIDRYYAFDTLLPDPETGFVLVAAGFPLSEINGPADEEFRDHLIIVFFVAAVAFGIAWIGTEYLVARPVRRLTLAARRIERGDTSARAEIQTAPPDLKLLGRQFDSMAASVERLDHAQRDFINNSGHELATPLTPIRVQTSLLAHRAAQLQDPALLRTSDSLTRNVNRLALTVDGVLKVAQLQSRTLDLEVHEADLDEIVTNAIEARRADFEAKKVNISADLHDVPKLLIDGDGLKLAVGHLLDNALRFTPGGGSVTVSLERGPLGVRFAVKDTGIGFRPGDEIRLFRPFGRVHDAMEDTKGGLGLGLFFVRDVVERSGGTVFAYSAGAGKGAEFGFLAPI